MPRRTHEDTEPLLLSTHIDEDDDQASSRKKLSYEETVEKAGFGLFHWLLLAVCGWANASDAVEILCVSFLLPTARCDLLLTSADMGLLTASIFLAAFEEGAMISALATFWMAGNILAAAHQLWGFSLEWVVWRSSWEMWCLGSWWTLTVLMVSALLLAGGLAALQLPQTKPTELT